MFTDWYEFLTDPTWTLAVTVGDYWAALAAAGALMDEFRLCLRGLVAAAAERARADLRGHPAEKVALNAGEAFALGLIDELFARLKETTMKNEAELRAAAAAAGIDWNRLVQFMMTQGLPFILALIDVFKKQPPVAQASGNAEDHAAHLKAHFEAIAALAECGANCCKG